MKIKDLIKDVEVLQLSGDPEKEIKGISYDSRKIRKGDIFVALRGTFLDGHSFIYDAIDNGASGLVVEEIPVIKTRKDICLIKVKDTRKALSRMALNFFNPALSKMSIIGITGTNGKTTTSYLIESILSRAGKKTGVIGTINYRFCGKIFDAPVTTPGSLELMQILKQMGEGGVTDVIMEVSSHSLAQERVADCPFKIGVFTNMTRDHLDYHGSIEEYFRAKARLFLEYQPLHSAINADDPMGKRLIKELKGNCITYGLKGDADIRAQHIKMDTNGIRAIILLPDKSIEVSSPLIGTFNLYNILASAAACYCLGIDAGSIERGINALKGVPGRMQILQNGHSPYVIVDYAHTPDALLNVLKSIRSIFKKRLITVFGCGGDRDRGKRRDMGEIAARYSDIVIITSDNPRSEDPYHIMQEIEDGIKQMKEQDIKYLLEVDRRKAIEQAIAMAHRGDVVLVAGKGHENYQIIGDKKLPFDDKQIIRDILHLNDKNQGYCKGHIWKVSQR